MQPFELVRLPTLSDAQARVAGDPARREFRAGGLDIMDRMKEGLDSPDQLVELTRLSDDDARSLRGIEGGKDGLRIGALTTLSELAERGDSGELSGPLHALAQAAGEAATPGIRNIATLGGNLLQRPRCWYFRREDLPCLKKGGAVCLAVSGDNRYHAILGGGPSYIVHPSSLAGPLVALGAIATIREVDGELRTIPIAELFALPTVDPKVEHTLAQGEVVLDLTIPEPGGGARSAYVAVREKQSHDWPLAEASIALRLEGGKMKDVRVVLGHVAPIPWRAPEAEKALEGQAPDASGFANAASLALNGARPLGGNRYKIPLTQGVLRQALHAATDLPLPE